MHFSFNLLSSTQLVIGSQEYLYFKYTHSENNEFGYLIDKFEDPETRFASIQPISNTQYKDHDLDFTKKYIKIYDTKLINSIDRDSNSDKIVWNGFIYHVVPNSDWLNTGGWVGVLAVRISKYDGKQIN